MQIPKLIDSLSGARELLGWELVRHTPEGDIGGIIIETEAYHQDDEASHSFRGETKRTAPMFKSAGHLYVYFTYGMHWCLNIVTGPAGSGQGVLLRSLYPTRGIDLMAKNRRTNVFKRLTPGPATITQALAVPPSYSGQFITDTSLELIPPQKAVANIKTSPRIGISKAVNKPWRFFIEM